MVASVLIFGGPVIGLWHLWEGNSARNECEVDGERTDMVQHHEPVARKYSCREYLASSNTIHYGCRPNFKEIFGSIAERWGHVDVGVIVCGPSTLQSSVAKECRSQNLRKGNYPIFHFNSHSFDL
ncbi:hypothetical protein F0562_020132 [Nyssa sinensis]|uniref:Ferric reductase NAD binding domain-containing protein n=1 Tax=Nyssa sinensis TaxID=561372 RepID=A0A5J5BR71_9ASTE|nr:hypothetical protein F0562_020132 [Nyssa sinensis]